MDLNDRTILITGGGSGIGYAIAQLLTQKGNQVIIVGRSKEKLQKAAASLQNVSVIACDVTDEQSVTALVQTIQHDYPNLSVLINNAGKAFVYQHGEGANAYDKVRQEMETNYFAPIRLTEAFLPLLKKQKDAIVVNTSSILALSPAIVLPTYSDSKAALHSYTLSLRKVLADTSVKVVELMPPMVNTEFSKDINGASGIPPIDVAQALAQGIENDEPEVLVGLTAPFAQNFFPKHLQAFETINQQQ